MSARKPGARRLFCTLAISGALLLSVSLAHRAVAQTVQMTPEEQAAVQLVQEWFAAWNTNDPEKVAAYLSPNVEFRSFMDSPECHGPAPLMTRVKTIMSIPVAVSDVKAYAVADQIDLPSGAPRPPGWGVAVLSSRVDTFGGGRRAETMSAYIIVADGKIQEFWEEPARTYQPAGSAARRPPLTCAAGLQAVRAARRNASSARH